jgi:hypothetical protein
MEVFTGERHISNEQDTELDVAVEMNKRRKYGCYIFKHLVCSLGGGLLCTD